LGAGLEPVRLLLDGMDDVAVIVDRDGRVLYTNREARTNPVTGTTVFDHGLGPEAEARMRAALHQVFTGAKPISYEVEAGGEGGERVRYLSRWSPLQREGKVVAALIISTDITRTSAVRDEWQEVILESAAEGILGLNREGIVTFANSAVAGLLGASRHELRGASVHDLVHGYRPEGPSHDAGDCPVLLSLKRGTVEQMEDDEFWRHDGASFPVQYTSSPIVDHDELMGAVLTFNDVTERKRFEAQLQFLADHDPLTGVHNRRRFEQELARHLNYDARYGSGGAVLALDLDNFKIVNDTYGHKAGDEVITRVARTIRARLRETDALGRLGGDEFAIILPEAGVGEAEAVARSIIDAIRTQAVTTAGEPVRVTASVGITTFGDRQIDGESLLVEADLAMYDAKAAGRDTFTVYTPTATQQAQVESRLAWVSRVRTALEQGRFTLYSQPVVSVATGKTVHHELLLRLVDDGQIVLPGSFLASAERFGLMPAVDRWVIQQAVRLLADTDAALRLEVNVSGKSLADEALTQALEAELAATDVDPGRLIVEVIEQTAVANMEETRRFAQEVKRLGCRFALDDFGAGFGSFYYLKYLPFDYLKIDGDFIQSLPVNRTDQLVVQAVADIARGLGKRTIAEFVGDDDTLALLQDCGVDLAQGYHLGRPGPAEQIAVSR
jgi:diguanylate cyclase (GGDEF)-like protein/PAS domain S-box-containing protein